MQYIVRFTAGFIVIALVQYLYASTANTITDLPFSTNKNVGYLVGLFVAWKFIGNKKIWGKATKKNDVE